MTVPSAPLVTGAGDPVTIVAHGFGASLAETRPMLSGVVGTRVFGVARGHGAAPAPSEPGYGELARDLEDLVAAHAATQAFGVSMGAATILRVLVAEPHRFQRIVFFLPAALDRPRDRDVVERLGRLAAALEAGDADTVFATVLAELPSDLRAEPAVHAYAAARMQFLLNSPGLPALLRALPSDRAVEDRGLLSAVTADVLVLAQEGDWLHPVQVAHDLTACLPRAKLVVFGQPGVMFRERRRLRDLVATHLSA